MTAININPEISDAIEAMLRALYNQLDKAKDKAGLAHDYIDLDHPPYALSTLARIEDEIKQATALYNGLLTLYRMGQEQAQNPLNLQTVYETR